MFRHGQLVRSPENLWLAIVDQSEENFIVLRRASGEVPDVAGVIKIDPSKSGFNDLEIVSPGVISWNHSALFLVEARYQEKMRHVERCESLGLFTTLENAVLFCQQTDVQSMCRAAIPDDVQVTEWGFAILRCNPDPTDSEVASLASCLVLTLDETGKPTR